MPSSEKFFSHERLEFIAKSLMDIVKLVFVAGVVGGFFVSSAIPIHLRIVGFMALTMAFVISIVTFPRKERG